MSAANPTRVVIDTNAVLDWLVFRNDAAMHLGAAVEARRWCWHATPAMLGELRAVLRRPLAERWEASRKHALTIDIELMTTMCLDEVPPPATRLRCRDPADQMFIDLALRSGPSWLVTRDRALLALRRQAAPRGVVIGTPEQWLLVHPLEAPVAAAPSP